MYMIKHKLKKTSVSYNEINGNKQQWPKFIGLKEQNIMVNTIFYKPSNTWDCLAETRFIAHHIENNNKPS